MPMEERGSHTVIAFSTNTACSRRAHLGSPRGVFHALGAAAMIHYSKGRVGNRLNLPISAELRLGQPIA